MTEKELEKIKLKFLKRNIQLYNDNKELIILYEKYIENIVELLDFIMGKNDDLFHTIVFNILMEIGFFSFNKRFDASKDNFKELCIKPGISVINGEGVCRNIACFYEDVFSYFYNYPLKICCFDKIGDNTKDTNIYGNHVINLTNYQGVLYGFDIMNHCLFKPRDDLELVGIDIDYSLIYKMYGDILMRATTDLKFKNDYVKEIEIKKEMFKESSNHNAITKENYIKIINDANEFIIKRKEIFQSFLKDNYSLSHEIKEKMLVL